MTKWKKTLNGYVNAGQDNQDIWKHIQKKYNEGWFIPSRAEIAAFANELGITDSENYNWHTSTYGLSSIYWCSSQSDSSIAWSCNFYNTAIRNFGNVGTVDKTNSVRLVTTF